MLIRDDILVISWCDVASDFPVVISHWQIGMTEGRGSERDTGIYEHQSLESIVMHSCVCRLLMCWSLLHILSCHWLATVLLINALQWQIIIIYTHFSHSDRHSVQCLNGVWWMVCAHYSLSFCCRLSHLDKNVCPNITIININNNISLFCGRTVVVRKRIRRGSCNVAVKKEMTRRTMKFNRRSDCGGVECRENVDIMFRIRSLQSVCLSVTQRKPDCVSFLRPDTWPQFYWLMPIGEVTYTHTHIRSTPKTLKSLRIGNNKFWVDMHGTEMSTSKWNYKSPKST